MFPQVSLAAPFLSKSPDGPWEQLDFLVIRRDVLTHVSEGQPPLEDLDDRDPRQQIMNNDRWQQLRELFATVREMSPEDRRAFLDKELAGDPELRAELDSLLDADPTTGAFFNPRKGERIEGSIGPYQLLEVLGEGGFGIVYLAQQVRPIRRQVALKVIKPGMDTRQVIARFEAERQALALMNHPGVAQVFEAGETEQGHPYFVMEYVDGLPITAFCDRERLSIRQRLELFQQVCDAIQHAHQKGVIHRDIKPSNVLVTLRNGVPVPVVIDFGIVKATTPSSPDLTAITHEGMIVGTLRYMSPEQAGGADAVDTRSDIYSLGVLLYELLTGELPFDSERLRRAALSEAVRVIREEEPPGLAARVERSGERSAELAKLRSTDSRGLLRELKGELQWITFRALEKQPERRYASPAEFAADVQRLLADEPVLAGPPSATYRVRKYMRRHRAGVAAAALVLLAILAGGVAAGIGFARAIKAERIARGEAESAERVTNFLIELFQSPTPDRALGQTITARTLLDIGARRIQGKEIQDPKVRARLLSAVGSAYSTLGLHEEGVDLLHEAAEETQKANGPKSAEYGKALSQLALNMRNAGEMDGVDSLTQRSVDILSQAEGANRNDLAMAILRQAEWRINSGSPEEGDSLVRVALEMAEAEAHPDTTVLVIGYSIRGFVAGTRGALEDQERDTERALSLAIAHFGEKHSRVLRLHRGLARVYGQMHKSDEALRHADAALSLAQAMFPEGHPSIASAVSGRGEALAGAYRWDEAIAAHEEALAMYRATYGAEHHMVQDELYSLGICYEGDRQINLAIDRMREACAMQSKAFGLENATTISLTRNLAELYASAGRIDEAEALFRKIIPYVKAYPNDDAVVQVGLADICRDTGRLAEADSLYLRARALNDTTSAYQRLYYGDCLTRHAYLRSVQGRHADAESLMQAGIAMQLRDNPEDSPELMKSFVIDAASRARAGNVNGAMQALKKAKVCGAIEQDAMRFKELAVLRSRPDYPLESSR